MAGWQAATSFATFPAAMAFDKSTCRFHSCVQVSALSSSYPAELGSLVRLGDSSSPHDSLLRGRWVKLICGASFEDVADVRNLSLVYTLAGVDCIDCAAEASVVRAVRDGIEAAVEVALTFDHHGTLSLQKPWIMVSINDDEDIHFRKAEFDSSNCPSSCPRPCEHICPAAAIQFSTSLGASQQNLMGGVLNDRCYGCGRCISICPLGLIGANSYIRDYDAVSDLLTSGTVHAVEIHTNARHVDAFTKLWESLHCSMESLKLIAVSLPDLGDDMLKTMWDLYNVMKPALKALNLWQMDGRPMSGDIGAGATRAAITLAAKVAAYPDRPPGFLQLAGGTNFHTVKAMKASALFEHTHNLNSVFTGTGLNTYEKMRNETAECTQIAGIAYGGYARKVVSQVIASMDPNGSSRLEHYPLLLLKAVKEANALFVCLINGVLHPTLSRPQASEAWWTKNLPKMRTFVAKAAHKYADELLFVPNLSANATEGGNSPKDARGGRLQPLYKSAAMQLPLTNAPKLQMHQHCPLCQCVPQLHKLGCHGHVGQAR